jgi:ketosteroid isomerase-like protein
MDTTTAPDVVSRYLRAADAGDAQGCAACFTPDGTVLDEGVTYRGRAEIAGWREATLGRWTYTSTVTGVDEPDAGGECRLTVRVEGDFPGGVADLRFGFTVRDGLVAALRIVERGAAG